MWERIYEKKIGKDWFVFCKCSCGFNKFVLRRNINSNKSLCCWNCSRKKLRKLDIVGKKFGKYLVISDSKVFNKKDGSYYLCRCDCGIEKIIRGSSLVRGVSEKCKDCHAANMRKHGMSNLAIYKVWKGMRARCFNINNPSYKWYGARGIKVCKRWEDFSKFLEDMGERPSPELEIDRIDNNGDYEPGNCRWTTKKINMNNMRRYKKN